MIHVDENDKKLMNLALNNITNINKYYESVGETVEIELVAYGPTHAVMSKKANKEIELLEEAAMVPSGVVQLIALEEKGYAYIRP